MGETSGCGCGAFFGAVFRDPVHRLVQQYTPRDRVVSSSLEQRRRTGSLS